MTNGVDNPAWRRENWLRLRFSRRTVSVALLCVGGAFLFRIPLRTPAERIFYVFEYAYFGILLLGFAGYLLRNALLGRRLNLLDLQVLLLLLLPLIGALASRRSFGQPPLYGIAAQREFIGVIAASFILVLLQRRRIDLAMVERALLVVTWATVIHWLFLYLFVDYSAYAALGGRVSHNELRGERLRWDRIATAFGAIYYGIRSIRRPSWQNYAAWATFSWYILIVTLSRGFAVAYIGVMLVFMSEHSARTRGRWIKYAVYGLFASCFLVVLPVLLFPGLVEYVEKAYGSLMTVVFTGEFSEERSANARIMQIGVILPMVREHFLFGYGELSRQFAIDRVAVIGNVPTNDLGIVGGIFTSGFAGVAICLWPYIALARPLLRVSPTQAPLFVVAAKYFILYFLFATVIGNSAIHHPAPGLVVLAALAYYFQLERAGEEAAANLRP